MTTLHRVTALLLLAAGVACGVHGPADAPDVATFRATAGEIDAAAAGYDAAAAGVADREACLEVHAGYRGDVGPMIDRMRAMADEMDARMSATCDDARHADMACAADAMRAELDRHGAAACPSEHDMAANAAEAAGHVAAMRAWAEHQRVRAGELDGTMGGGMMGGGGMHGSSTFTCPVE